MTSWQQLSLGDVLRLDLDKIAVDPATDYEMVGVLSFGRGLFDREPVSGGSTSYKTFYRLGAEHIVMSQLFGWEGALALSNDEYAGKYVSTQFPTFLVDEEKMDRKFAGWWMQQISVWDELKSKAKGMGDRRRTLNPDSLLTCSIHLPPLDEQRRIVEKIESLAARVDEAKQLRLSVQADMNSLLVAMAHRNDLSENEKTAEGWQQVVLGDVLIQVSDPVGVEPGKEYPHFGIYSFARGLFKKAPLRGDEIKASKLFRAHEGQFIYSRLKAFEGAFGEVSAEYDGCHVSNEFPTFDLDCDRISLAFLVAYTKSTSVWKSLAVHSKGVGARRERLKPENFLAEKIWLPPMEWQQKIKSVAEQLFTTKSDREAMGLGLEALLPAILDRAFKGKL